MYLIHTVDIHGSVELVIFPNDSIIPDIHKAPWYRERDLLGMCDVYPFFVLDLGGGGGDPACWGEVFVPLGSQNKFNPTVGQGGQFDFDALAFSELEEAAFWGGECTDDMFGLDVSDFTFATEAILSLQKRFTPEGGGWRLPRW